MKHTLRSCSTVLHSWSSSQPYDTDTTSGAAAPMAMRSVLKVYIHACCMKKVVLALMATEVSI